jgi:cytochrome c-type biogenesis protein
VLGFGVVFTLLGAAVGLMGRSLNAWMPLLQKIGAVLLVIFALVTLGVISRLSNWIKSAFDVETNAAAAALVGILDWLNGTMYTERRVTDMHEVHRGWGYATSFMLGVSFAAGWVPCIGPILASILFLASDSATVWQGTILLAVYSMGLAIPFLITGLFFNRMTPFLRRLNQHSGIVSLVTGVLLLYVAYLLWFDKLGSLTNQFAILNQWVLGIEEWFGVVTGTAGDVTSVSVLSALPIAFFAGLLSFISPCVLPLVPAYIGYLTSTAVAGTSGGQQAA